MKAFGRMIRKYQKNIGKEVEVICTDGIKLTGLLTEATEQHIQMETKTREKVEGHKKKQLVEKTHLIEFDKMEEKNQEVMDLQNKLLEFKEISTGIRFKTSGDSIILNLQDLQKIRSKIEEIRAYVVS